MQEGSKVQAVYVASTAAALRTAYDDWANDYDQELFEIGYCSPSVAAAIFGRFITKRDGPFLDAGCGTGLQVQALRLAGFSGFTGIDLSPEMLKIAESKNLYDTLLEATLGETLPFANDQFEAVLSTGAITQNHAPPESFDELIRVTRPGGLILFTLRDDPTIDPRYQQVVDAHSEANRWNNLYTSDLFQSMPYGEPDVLHRFHVYQVA